MNTLSNRRFTSLTVGLLLLAGCSSKAQEPEPPSEAVGSVHEHWMIAGSNAHGAQAEHALGFLSADVRFRLAKAETLTDMPRSIFPNAKDPPRSEELGKELGTKEHSFFHFDNCRFQGSTVLLREHYDVILEALDADAGPYSPDSPAWDVAMKQFGFILHAVQDFYAHSNWVESGEKGLVDSGGLEWTVLKPNQPVGEHLQVVEGPLLTGASASLDRENHLLNLKGTPRSLGLMTGRYANADHDGATACLMPDPPANELEPWKPPLSMLHGPGFFCDEQDLVDACKHEGLCGVLRKGQADCSQIWLRTYLAKDSNPYVSPSVSPAAHVEKRMEWRNAAQKLAREQTTHEFCRLANLLEKRYPAGPNNKPESGRDRLYNAWVADPAAADEKCKNPSTYVDSTLRAGLFGVEGSRIGVADLNGDHYPDLVVRKANDRESDFSDLTMTKQQSTRLLINDGTGKFQDKTTSSKLLLGRVTGSGLRNQRAAQVVAFADVNNDGKLDVFTGTPPYTPKGLSGTESSELMLNDGQGVFSRYTTNPLPKQVYPGGATFVDFDRNGVIDLFLPARDPASSGPAERGAAWLFRGTGNAAAPLVDATTSIPSAGGGYFQSSLACDLNGDGWPELMTPAMDRGLGRLWQAKGNGSYVERGVASGFAADSGITFEDNLARRAHCSYVNATGRVWDSFWSKASHCQSRSGGCPSDCNGKYPCDSFRTATAADKTACAGAVPYPTSVVAEQAIDAAAWVQSRDSAPHRLGGHVFTMQCADFDGDGRLDILQAASRSSREGASADAVRILHNITPTTPGADVKFENVDGALVGALPKHEAGVAWSEDDDSAVVLDMNNDGRPDILLNGTAGEGSRGRLLRNETVSVAGSTDLRFVRSWLPGLERAAGAAAADFDRDGDLDLVVGHSCRQPASKDECDSEQIQLFENQLEAAPTSAKNWIELKLVGKGTGLSNKAAIGARVSLSVNGRTLVQEVGGGYGTFGMQSDLVLHFGLGSTTPEITLRVTWPASRTNRSEEIKLAVNKVYLVEEGDLVQGGASASPAKVTPLSFPK